MSFLSTAKNGCSTDIFWRGKKIYYPSSSGLSPDCLGEKLDKNSWITENIQDQASFINLNDILSGWELYREGWLFNQGPDKKLFYYLCQIGISSRPIELDLLKKYKRGK